MADQTVITLDKLQKSAAKFQKELIVMPVIGAEATLKHMTGRPNVQDSVTVGELTGNVEFGPYDRTRKSEGGFKITPRTLQTYLGNCTHDFDPNDIWDTIYGSMIHQGDALKNVDIARAILDYSAAQLGKKLNMAIWAAVRKDSGTTTNDLFNGFDTITATEITAGTIAAANGNFMSVAKVTKDNAVDILKSIYQGASAELQGVPVKMFLTREQYNMYNEDYKQSTGAIPYNTEFKKTFLEGSDNLCELVPLTSKKGSSYIHLTEKKNMVYGYGNGSNPKEKIAVGKYSSWLLTLEAAMNFGVQMESINAERLMVAQVAAE